MKKKLLSIAAACVLGVQAIAMPMIANAEQGTQYVTNSEYDVRLKADTQDFNFMMGWFEDPTSSGFNAATQVALNLRFSLNGVTANNGVRTENLATLQADKWYKVRVTLDNNFEEYSAVVTDVETGKVVGSLLDAAYQASIPSGVTGIKTTCWGYIRGNTYDFDLTNVTIGKSDTKYSAQ